MPDNIPLKSEPSTPQTGIPVASADIHMSDSPRAPEISSESTSDNAQDVTLQDVEAVQYDPHSEATYSVFRAKRRAATKSRKYCSQDTRQRMIDGFRHACDGKEPYTWQLDAAEAVLLGLDCLVVAGTGAGKTYPFVMPLLADPTKSKKVIIISPLNDLEADQAARFRRMGLTATPVNGDIYNEQFHKRILSDEFQVLLPSPEMCLKHELFSKLMRTPDFMKNVAAIVIDEAHCISQWGETFRKDYRQLAKLRSFVPLDVPILATSATLPPHVLADVKAQLCFDSSDMLYINLGNDRHNITPIVSRMRGAAGDLNALNFAIDEAAAGLPLPKTLIFFNTRLLVQDACEHLRDLLPEHLRHEIDFLHAFRTPLSKQRVMKDFRAGRIKILCATEAAGMGLDIGDIVRVIQFMLPDSLSIWFQRYGRGGRAGHPTIVVLLVEDSAFQLVKKSPVKRDPDKASNADAPDSHPDDEDFDRHEHHQYEQEDEHENDENDEDNIGAVHDAVDMLPAATANTKYRKKVEGGLRAWIDTSGCRRDVADKYFANTTPRVVPTVPCCDNCLLRLRDTPSYTLTPLETETLAFLDSVHERTSRFSLVDHMLVDDSDNPDPLSPHAQDSHSARSSRPGQRRGKHLTTCRTALSQWVEQCWKQNYPYCIWGPNILLPDKVLTKLASLARIQTLDDLMHEIPEWAFADTWGSDVLQLLAKLDADEKREKERILAEKRSIKKEESARKKALRTEQRREELYQARQQKKAANSANGMHLQYHVLQTVPQVPSNIPSSLTYSTFPVSASRIHYPLVPGPSQPSPPLHMPYYPIPAYAYPVYYPQPLPHVSSSSMSSTVSTTYPHFPSPMNPL